MHTVRWFQLLSYNSHNSTSVICLHTVCSIWPIDRTLSGATTPGQSGPESNGNEGVFCIFQISTAGASPSDNLMSYPGHSLGVESYFSIEMQSVYSNALETWAWHSWLKHELCFIGAHIETNASCCLLQVLRLRFGFRRYVCKKRSIVFIVCICNRFCGISFASWRFFSLIDIRRVNYDTLSIW